MSAIRVVKSSLDKKGLSGTAYHPSASVAATAVFAIELMLSYLATGNVLWRWIFLGPTTATTCLSLSVSLSLSLSLSP